MLASVNPLVTLRVAARALLRNTMRSFLTALGIIIGVAAVSSMVAIGQGATGQVEQAFAAMGADVLIISSGSSTSGGARGGSGSIPTLTWDDLKAIQTQARQVRYAAPHLRITAQVMSEEQNWMTQITSVTPEYFTIRTWRAAQGAPFSQSDVDGGTKVVVLGQTVAEKLFGPEGDPTGQRVRIRNIPFQVIGVLEPKGQSATGHDHDDSVYIPVSTFRSKIQGGLGNFIAGSIYVSAVSPGAVPRAQAEIESLLRERHHIQKPAENDFSIRNLAEVAEAREEGARTLSLLLASIAAVSLLVGGIGIMNIMLVSVTERTREIGLRMAVGAKPRNILLQFLVEALTLSA